MRDPLQQAAAAIMKTEGLATKPCEKCFRAGRELQPPDVYVCRQIGTEADGRCYVVYECRACGDANFYEIAPHLMLAADLRLDALGRVEGTVPAFFYSLSPDGDEIDLWLDPADGMAPIKLGHGPANAGSAGRARAAIDFLAGGDGKRDEPTTRGVG